MNEPETGADFLLTIRRLRAIDKRLSSAEGLSVEEMHCLILLHLQRPGSVKELRGILNLTPSHVSKLLRGLERQQFVLREIDPTDQRKGKISLTPPGTAKAMEILEILRNERIVPAAVQDEPPRQPDSPPSPGSSPAVPTPPVSLQHPESWEPSIIAFFCNWCTYTAADLAGVSRLSYSPNVRVIRLMCSGRVDPQFILDAFRLGADGVLVGGCHPGDCHYIEGNIKTLRRMRMLERVLEGLGIDRRRCRLEWISASEGEKVKQVVNEMVAELRSLGPLALPDQMLREDRELFSGESGASAVTDGQEIPAAFRV